MITITCQYTGFKFQAESKRSKNHPMVSVFLNDASSNKYQHGAYAQAKSILEAANGQFDTVEELIEYANEAYQAWCDSGVNSITVLSHKEKVANSKRFLSAVLRKLKPGEYEELTDGNAFSG